MKALAQALDVVLVQLPLPAQHFQHHAARAERIQQILLLQLMLVDQKPQHQG
jgi:hypothetical protein